MRIGQGYDVHKLVPDRELILGGVTIPYEKGLLGHSDADVLVHAVMDALLGAAALGDIGQHFPDTDPAYEGASSIELLKKVGKLLQERVLTEFHQITCNRICRSVCFFVIHNLIYNYKRLYYSSSVEMYLLTSLKMSSTSFMYLLSGNSFLKA